MAQTLEQFDPVAAGFRVSTGPIQRKKRRASTRPQPKPKYADAVWYSFEHDHPLEVSVPVRSVEDTVRQLKRAARYLERTKSTQAKPVEVRVQISVEPDPDPTKKNHSLVKFLGHKPWLLGRRISKVEADAREAGVQAAEDVIAARPAPRHRRTTAATRSTAGHRATGTKASLRDALVWPVISPQQPSFPVTTRERGLLCFPLVFKPGRARVSRSLLPSYPGCTMSSPLQRCGGV